MIPATIWLTGLSASGKTTLGEHLYADLLLRGVENIVLLDGEAVREQLGSFGYLAGERTQVAFKKAELARKFNQEGKTVIVTGISHKRETRAKLREYLGRFMEVYLKCPVAVCAQRDYKGQYQKALAGELANFIGVTADYEESNPELVLNTEQKSVDECAEILLSRVLVFLNGHKPD